MRDPTRIQRILDKLEKYWVKYPNMRLGQIIVNSVKSADPFYKEDTLIEGWLDSMLACDELTTEAQKLGLYDKPKES